MTTKEVLKAIDGLEEIWETIALADAIAWQMAKDGGAAGITLSVWEQAIWLAERLRDGRERQAAAGLQ